MGLKNFYEEKILSRMITMACGQDEISELRAQLIPLAQGDVFELGCGGGLNQRYYDRDKVVSFAGIDPNHTLLDGARARAAEKGWPADLREGVGEAIPFEDHRFDTVVCTYTLCSVGETDRVLSEMRRILKPGGQLLFLEHGRAPDAGPQKWQRRIEPVWKRLAGNCHLTRPVFDNVRKAGFAVEEVGSAYADKAPRWAGWMEWGVGRKSGE